MDHNPGSGRSSAPNFSRVAGALEVGAATWRGPQNARKLRLLPTDRKAAAPTAQALARALLVVAMARRAAQRYDHAQRRLPANENTTWIGGAPEPSSVDQFGIDFTIAGYKRT